MDNKFYSKVLFIFLFILISVLSGVLGGILVYNFLVKDYVPLISQKSEMVVKKVTKLQDDSVINVVKNATDSVVSIVASKNILQPQYIFSPFFLPNNITPQKKSVKKEEIGGGTGFFISSDGLIVTNRHVVADSGADYTVITKDRSKYKAKVLAKDEVFDFAIIKIDGTNFHAVTLGDSDNINIGQTVVAIGNSLGKFAHSVSKGIISGVQRNIVAGGGPGIGIEHLNGIIQTDAAINFGNSGGPLLDLNGKVIGINTARAQGAENVGFAIPINQVKQFIEDVKQTGKISRPFLGVRYIPVNKDIQEKINLPYKYGILVIHGGAINDIAVLPNSPADKVGIEEYDVILRVDGQQIDKEHTLSRIIASKKVGDTIKLELWHKGVEKNISVILEDRNLIK